MRKHLQWAPEGGAWSNGGSWPDLINEVFLTQHVYGLGKGAPFTWGRDRTRLHYEKRARPRRQ